LTSGRPLVVTPPAWSGHSTADSGQRLRIEAFSTIDGRSSKTNGPPKLVA
jgi:hypothetical protein